MRDIGAGAFYGCTSLSSITLPEGLRGIGEDAFRDCSGLRVIVSKISAPFAVNAFSYFKDIENRVVLIVPKDSINAYWQADGWDMFDIIEDGEDFYIEEHLDEQGILYNLLYDSEGLYYSVAWHIDEMNADIVIPAELRGRPVKKIEERVFADCGSLKSITLPESVKHIGASAFSGCNHLTTVNIEDLSAWCNIQFENGESNPLNQADNLYLKGEKVTDLFIPASVTSIGQFAFYGYSNLKSITLPESVKYIGKSAFYHCYGLSSVNIEDLSVWCNIQFENGDSNPLNWADNLYLKGEKVTDLVIPTSVTSIGKFAFYGWFNLKSITLPESVTSIGTGAFYDCSGLRMIVSKISVPFAVDAFSYCEAALIVPKGLQGIYKKTRGWETFFIYEEGESVYNNFQTDEQGVSYTLMQDSEGSLYYSVTGWNENLKKIANVVIPADLGGCPVRTIREGWLEYGYDIEIESITLPECLNSIGARAFIGCRNLSTVVFGSQLKTIGEYAFSRCSSLKSISIPDGVTEIGEFAFCHCDNMTSVIIGNGVKTLKGGTFYNCGNLTSVILGDEIARIEYSELMIDENYEECSGNYGVFSSCKNLSSINIPKTMIHIGAYAFSGCSNLTSITLPDNPSYNDISSGIFSYSGITSIKIPNHVKYINNSAFEGCSALTSVKFSENLLRIDEDAFKGCKLKSIELPNTIKEISEGLFKDCDFQYIKLGNNVTRIGKNALGGSDFVLEIGTSTPPEISSGAFPDVKYLSDLTVIVPDAKAETAYRKKAVWEEMTYANQDNIAEVTVDTPGDLSFELIDECGMMPAKVVGLKVNGTINADDFKQMLTNMKALLRLDLSDCDITEIPDSALSGKRQLQELILPSKLQTIGDKAFKDCPYLTGRLDLPTTLSSVGDSAFVGTEYTSITLPYSLKTIGDYAFYQLPIEQKLTLPARLTSVGSHAFEGTNITGVTIPDVVTTIGDNAFANTPMQDHVTIPDGVTYLGKEAFSNMNISTVFLPNSVTKLSHGLFQGCKNLNLVYIPDNITDMGDYAFDGCESMVIMRLSANIETMGEYSLQGTPMDYIKVPSKVETLSRGVLKDSKNLVSLSLPANLKSVESEALYGCTALRNLSVEAIEPPVIADRSAIRGINTDLCIISIPTDSYREYVLAEYWGQFVQMRNDIAVEASGDGEISFESVVEEEGLEDTVVYSQYLTSAESEMRAPSFATKEDAQTYVNNGSSIYIPKQGQVRLHFIPGKGEKLLSATLDGEDITPHIVDNIYIARAEKKNAKLVVKFSGESNTAIENVISEGSLKDSVYNLNGQLIGIDIDVTSLPKGIYIVNGKKIVVK